MLPVLVALAIVAILLFVISAGQPDEFVVSRSGKIAAPPERFLFTWTNSRNGMTGRRGPSLILMQRTPLPARQPARVRR